MAFFREAQEHGEVRGDLMPSELTTVLLTSMFSVMLSQPETLSPELRPALKRVIDVFVRGVIRYREFPAARDGEANLLERH